ncbi:MAG: endonuclease [Chloroflexi bacterium]|nr:endonuclease [Chloroflexota bacterium]
MTQSSTGAGTSAITVIFQRLGDAYEGDVWHWSPDYVRGSMDIIAGAILVQHTNWQNAERALESLRAAGALDPGAILALTDDALAGLIRVSGTPSVKARRLRSLAQTITDAGGLDAFLALPLEQLRPRLLATHGVGSETADAIALYAAGHRTFVIDAYTRRVFRRIGIAPDADAYEAWHAFFERALPDADATAFQQYHAWIVLHAKARCRTRPACDGCPLLDACESARHVPSGGRIGVTPTLPAAARPPVPAAAAQSGR